MKISASEKRKKLLSGKRILIVDDEPDILDTLEELLAGCNVVKASSADEAVRYLETDMFDIAILDIMGVDGFRLLEIAREKNIIPVMLTAKALDMENISKAREKGAASFVPKDKMMDIDVYLADILEAEKEGKQPWQKWFYRFGNYFEKRFGTEWNSYEEFWKDALKDKDRGNK